MGSQLEGTLQSIREEKAWLQKSEAAGHIAPRAGNQKDNRVGGGQDINPHSGQCGGHFPCKPMLSMKADRKRKVERSLEFSYYSYWLVLPLLT